MEPYRIRDSGLDLLDDLLNRRVVRISDGRLAAWGPHLDWMSRRTLAGWYWPQHHQHQSRNNRRTRQYTAKHQTACRRAPQQRRETGREFDEHECERRKTPRDDREEES